MSMFQPIRRAFCLAIILVAFVLTVFPNHSSFAQIANAEEETEPAAATRLGDAVLTRYRVGVRVTAAPGGAQQIRAMIAVPLECREQTVQVVREEYSPEVEHVDFRMLAGDNARQMLVRMPRIDSRRTGEALITYDVVTRLILPPRDTSQLTAPRRPSRQIKQFMGPSPYIDVNHRRIRAVVKEALEGLQEPTESEDETSGGSADDSSTSVSSEVAKPNSDAAIISTRDDGAAGDSGDIIKGSGSGEQATELNSSEPSEDWRRVEALYDYAIEHVEYKEGVDKSSVQVLKEGVGDCQAIGALFVAMCRTEKIPARLVWVHDHQYAEFYLEDADGNGHWYPVETAGRRAFGEMPLPRVILQKGDNFRVPERPRERLRYASDYLLGFPAPGAGKPRVKYIREQL